jgi:phosphoenolpyruvate carboxylase
MSLESDKDQPLREETRLLGRLLGEAIRTAHGDATFERVETIRKLAVDFRKTVTDEAGSKTSPLLPLLKTLSIDDSLAVVRAFSLFSLLANLAEDRHQNRRNRAHRLAGSAPKEGSLAHVKAAFLSSNNSLSIEKIVQHWLEEARIAAVLTAHPTEVQRQSILSTMRAIDTLLNEREASAAIGLSERSNEHVEAEIAQRVHQLWLTAMLRLARLRVVDEIENALVFYRQSLIRVLPEILLDTEQAFGASNAESEGSFLAMGSWIGGDRDGNPFVTALTLETALQRQASTILAHYLHEVHELGRDLML